MRRGRLALLAASAAAALAGACRSNTTGLRVSAATRGPTLTLVDSVMLQEPDSLPLGAYTTFIARARDGRLFVADMQLRRVLEFGADGRFVRAYGKAGSGPEEFMLPGTLGLVHDDSVLAVVDVNRSTMLLFDTHDGRGIRTFTLPVRDIGQHWTLSGDTAVFAVHLGPALLARWNWRADTIQLVGHLPADLRHAISVAMLYGRSEIAPRDAGFVGLLPGEQGLDVFNSHAQLRETVILPAARRRGEPSDLMFRQAHLSRDDPHPVLASSAAALDQLPSGELLVAKLDMDVIGTLGHGGRYGAFRLYLSLVSPNMKRACVDALVPLPSDVAPIPVFSADTVFVLSRDVTADNKVHSTLYGFTIGNAGCDWVPTVERRIVGDSITN